MILEGIVTTLGPEDALNVAPMGPRIDPADPSRFELRPFRTSTTYRNLRLQGEGVLHVCDDVLLFARAAIGRLDLAALETRPATAVRGRVLLAAARYHEFRVLELDDRDERATIRAETLHTGRLGDLFGLNRAKHAVIEAAILATRLALLPADVILDDLRRLAPLVEKTGGQAERDAFALLEAYVSETLSRTPPDDPAGRPR